MNQKGKYFFLAFFLSITTFVFAQEPPVAMVDSNRDGREDSKRLLFEDRLFDAFTARATENPQKQIKKLREALEIFDDEAIVHYELSKVLSEEGELDEALHHAFKAVEFDPTNVWMLRHFSTMLRMNEMWEDRIVILEELKRIDDNDLEYDLKISESQAALGAYKKAIKTLNQIEKSYGVIPDLAERKKNIWLAANKPKKAERELKKLVKAYPDVPQFWGVLANFYRANNKPDKAISAFETLLEYEPDDSRAHFNLAEMHRQNNNIDAFMFHLREGMRSPDVEEDVRLDVIMSTINASLRAPELRSNIEDMLTYAEKFHPNSPKVHALRGDYFISVQDIENGLKSYKRALELEGGRKKEIYQQVLRIHLEKMDFEALAQYGKEAVTYYPNQNQFHYFAGIGLMETSQDSMASVILQEGLDITYGNPELKNEFHRLLGETNHRAGFHEASDQHFDAYLKNNPKDALTLNNYAYYLSVRGEKLDKALEMTVKSNNISVNNPVYLDTWAWVLYKMGEFKEARNILERVVDLGGADDPEVREHFGDILHALGEKDKAVVEWKKAIELGGDKDELQKKIDQK
ncbi:MAG: tetratricopeptide repeat protein [Cryomorphaceae bacterium]|nr:tetratricopeptide repeat protein [Cryomorphaceae bacterium]